MAKGFYGSVTSEADVTEFFTDTGWHDRAIENGLCGLCGAMVGDEFKHRDFHVQQAKLLIQRPDTTGEEKAHGEV